MTRLVATAFMAAVASSCSGGSTSMLPQEHRAPSGHTTAATFTIKWTSATATAAVRRRDTISPSAQSVTVAVNGTILAVANRNGNSTQTIPITAPVGADLFTFNVYDLPNATGHLLGTATVTQQIIDGAANAVTAVIQAVCAATNISIVATPNALFYGQNAPPSGIATVLQSLEVVGQIPVEIAIEPQDVDGNVIFTSSTGGTVPFTVTGSVSVTPLDGSHLSLAPNSGLRSTTPDTLTAAASGCPSASIGVEHSPAIYAENTSYYARIIDWYGHTVGGNTLATGDALIGYDTQSGNMIAYNKTSGQVNAYPVNLSSPTPKYVIPANLLATWSNYAHAPFGAVVNGVVANYYKYINGQATYISNSNVAAANAVAASTFSTNPAAYTALANGAIGEFSLSTNGFVTSAVLSQTPVTLATDDRTNILFVFNSTSPYVTLCSESVTGCTSSDDTFTGPTVVGAADTDGDNVYHLTAGGNLEAASSNGTQLSGFGYTIGTPLALVVLSTNER